MFVPAFVVAAWRLASVAAAGCRRVAVQVSQRRYLHIEHNGSGGAARHLLWSEPIRPCL